METTDYTTQDGRGQLQPLRRLLAQAVTESLGNTAKVLWLHTELTALIIEVTADKDGKDLAITQDPASSNTKANLINAFRKAASEAVIYGSDYKTQLIQDLTDADTIVSA